MMEFGGWQFPDGEQHLVEWMRKRNVMMSGRLSYQDEKIKLALKHAFGRRTAVDVGAHIGLWTFHLAKEFAFVHAFEPVLEHRECFDRNVNADNVTLHSYALEDSEGMLEMTRYPGNSGHSHVSATAIVGDGELVFGRTLDSFELTEVDLIKIDCEGFELKVLKGAVETLQRYRPTIIVEQKPGNGSRYGYGDTAALPWLEKMGAKMADKRAGDYVFVWP